MRKLVWRWVLTFNFSTSFAMLYLATNEISQQGVSGTAFGIAMIAVWFIAEIAFLILYGAYLALKEKARRL